MENQGSQLDRITGITPNMGDIARATQPSRSALRGAGRRILTVAIVGLEMRPICRIQCAGR